MKKQFEQKVYYGDTDAYGVAWHGSYIHWLEKGRTDFLEDIGFSAKTLMEKDIATPLANLNIKYKLFAMLDDDLIIDSIPYKEKACGLISGKNELQKWSKTDLFQFCYDTKSLYGKLEDIIQPPSLDEIKQSVKTSSENLYHATIHNFVHSNNYVEDLQNLYKMTFFILQAKYFVQTNIYVPTKKQLVDLLNGTEKEILNICINKENILNYSQSELETLYCKLIKWLKKCLLFDKF